MGECHDLNDDPSGWQGKDGGLSQVSDLSDCVLVSPTSLC